MFYYIKGKLALAEESIAVIDVAGVGYMLTVSSITQAKISAMCFNGEKEVKLYTYLSVREDGVELFGFNSLEELSMFKLLISVSGIGPKAAMSLLSFMPPEEISAAIYKEDKKTISKASGIGPKTAARIILELKDKVNADSTVNDTNDSGASFSTGFNTSAKYSEALDALTVLGFTRAVAENALKSIDIDNLEIEDVIRIALNKLMK